MKTRTHQSRSFRWLAGFLAFAQGALAIPLAAEPSLMPAMEPLSIEPVQTPPSVPPPPPTVVIPDQPTDQELFSARLFAEPLVPVGGTTTLAHNASLASALKAYRDLGAGEAVAPLRQFLQGSGSSPWRASLLVNLSIIMRRTGHYSRALADAEEAWQLAKTATEVRPAAVADRALGEIVELLSRLGRYQDLEARLSEVSARNILGSATERVSQAKQALWIMQNQPDVAFRCGPLAVERIFTTLNPGVTPPDAITNAVSTNQGTSLAQMAGLSQQTGMNLRMAFRPVGNAILSPALIHWRAGHFAAIIKESNGRYLVQDPTFGEETWLSREAIDDEASGYFLVSAGGSLPAGWRSVEADEGGTVWGKGVPNGQNPQNQGCNGGPPSGGNGEGCGGGVCAMATYKFHTMLVNLHIVDTPVSYSQAIGPAVAFQLSYNQRDAFQPQNFNYGNVGPKWTHDWLSYVTDDPSVVGGTVTVYLRGGGEETYSGYNAGTQLYGAHYMQRAVLKRVAGSPIEYHRLLPDGSKEVFMQSDGALPPTRKVLLTQIVDAQGQAVTFQYDASLRLVSVTDATGLVTTLSYEAADPLRITKVTDPFGRFATFTYSPNQGAPLASITDPIGITSQFVYGSNNFIGELTTPYGTTKFAMGESGYDRWLEATDPLGGVERLVYQNNHSSLVPGSDPPATVPPGFTNNAMNSGLSFFWDKRAMALYPGDFSKAEMSHWLWTTGTNSATAVLRSFKRPLENRVWYKYPAQSNYRNVGTHSSPSETARVLDDETAQSYRYEYNLLGKVIKAIDPVGRETVYVYGTGSTPDAVPATGTGMDLLQVKQKNPSSPGGWDVLQSATYNANHQPLTSTDTAGQVTTNTYLADGRLQTTVTPPRNGPDGNPLTLAERTTTYTYYPDNDVPSQRKRLQTVTGPFTAQGSPSATYTYDTYGRVQTTTDQEAYALTYSYDSLDRRTRTTYPDGTYEEAGYNRLDAERQRDRLGRWSHSFHDALRRVTSTRDPEGRTVTHEWCSCGSMDRLLDANGNATSWERDVQGRITREVRADSSAWEYTYETTTSRLKQRKDPKNQIATYAYLNDNNLSLIDYTNEVVATPDVTLTYDPNYNRPATLMDGTGTTSYGYHPIAGPAALGAGQLASVDGPLASDTITYGYDEMGRPTTRQINGAANHSTIAYDALSRVVRETNVVGTFNFGYQAATGRLASVAYPNGQASTYTFLGNTGDHRLQDIHHQRPGSATLSRHTYTTSPVGQITTWTLQLDAGAPTVYEYDYDRADQLTSAVQKTTGGSPAVLKTYSYAYDPAGNRTTEAIDTAVVKATYDNRNRLLQQQVGGSLRFAGTLNEPAAVTVAGTPAEVTGDNRFAGSTTVTSGTQTVPVVATDPAGNVKTQNYQVGVTGTGATLANDANGNLTSDGVRTFDWDAENRLIAVNQGTRRTEFTYNGASDRTRIVEKDGAVVLSDRRYLWCGLKPCEERDGAGTSVIRRFVALGVQEAGPTSFTYTLDHLGSIREMSDASGTLRARYEYDAYGRQTKLTGDRDAAFGFTGHLTHGLSAMTLAKYRGYAPGLGRWTSEDPAGLNAGDPNLARYATNDPTATIDPDGHVAIPVGGMILVTIIAITIIMALPKNPPGTPMLPPLPQLPPYSLGCIPGITCSGGPAPPSDPSGGGGNSGGAGGSGAATPFPPPGVPFPPPAIPFPPDVCMAKPGCYCMCGYSAGNPNGVGGNYPLGRVDNPAACTAACQASSQGYDYGYCK